MQDSDEATLRDPVEAARRSMQRAYLRDGLPEMLIGLAFLICAAGNWLQVVAPATRAARIIASLGSPACWIVLASGSVKIIQWLRRRYLIERTGFVEFKQPSSQSRRQALALAIASAVLSAVTAFAVIVAFRHIRQPNGWILGGTGLLAGGVQFGVFRVLGFSRFAVYGVLSLAAGIALALTSPSLEWGFAVFFGSLGALYLFSGLILFVRFVRGPVEAV